MTIVPVKISPQSFSPYGNVYHLKEGTDGVSVWAGQTFTDRMIELSPFGESRVHLGMTEGSPAPCAITSMEIHPEAEEAIVCIGDPILLCVAPWEGRPVPSAKHVVAFELTEGQVAVLQKNVWHDACHGIGKKAFYCWFAKACPEGLGWVHLDGILRLECQEA